MHGEPTAVSAMSDDQFADFTDQMRLSVAEEAYLGELPVGSRDLIGDDKWLVHGPWRQEDCFAAIQLWFNAGLVSLLRRWPEEESLMESDAREVLAARESWVLTPEGDNFALVETDAGAALAWGDWRSMLSALRRG